MTEVKTSKDVSINNMKLSKRQRSIETENSFKKKKEEMAPFFSFELPEK